MKVYYFTRTHRSEQIAKELASKYNLTVHKINDDKNWNGPINFIKGGYYSSTKKDVLCVYDAVPEDEKVILVFPIWAGSFPPAIRSFINSIGRDRILAIPTSLGSILKDRDDFIEVIDLVGKEIAMPDVSKFV